MNCFKTPLSFEKLENKTCGNCYQNLTVTLHCFILRNCFSACVRFQRLLPSTSATQYCMHAWPFGLVNARMLQNSQQNMEKITRTIIVLVWVGRGIFWQIINNLTFKVLPSGFSSRVFGFWLFDCMEFNLFPQHICVQNILQT